MTESEQPTEMGRELERVSGDLRQLIKQIESRGFRVARQDVILPDGTMSRFSLIPSDPSALHAALGLALRKE